MARVEVSDYYSPRIDQNYKIHSNRCIRLHMPNLIIRDDGTIDGITDVLQVFHQSISNKNHYILALTRSNELMIISNEYPFGVLVNTHLRFKYICRYYDNIIAVDTERNIRTESIESILKVEDSLFSRIIDSNVTTMSIVWPYVCWVNSNQSNTIISVNSHGVVKSHNISVTPVALYNRIIIDSNNHYFSIINKKDEDNTFLLISLTSDQISGILQSDPNDYQHHYPCN